ncbi:IS66-like element accessory protein TnpA [Gluconacetobacter sp. Hr-1-5]|uniref:IS66-like element accessory protein TnpA n=1 Tax=Gluconacetobacter sp. Hr-1-5 TaxID=3395370 RepID=UPI003B526759
MKNTDLTDESEGDDVPVPWEALGRVSGRNSGHTSARTTSGYGFADGQAEIEIRPRIVRRRVWSDDDKQRIVMEAFAPGTCRRAVASRYGVSSGQLYTWRKNLTTSAEGFIPVHVGPAAFDRRVPGKCLKIPGGLEITLADGVSIRVDGSCDPDMLCQLVHGLKRS